MLSINRNSEKLQRIVVISWWKDRAKTNRQTELRQTDKQRQYGGWFDKPRLVVTSLWTNRDETKAWFILPANANVMRIWHEFDVTTLFSLRYSQESWAQVNPCELFVANLRRQHSYRIRIRRKYEPGFTDNTNVWVKINMCLLAWLYLCRWWAV